MLIVKGVPVNYALREQANGLLAIKEYQTLLKKRDALKQLLDTQPNISNRAARENALGVMTSNLEASIVHQLVEEGIFQSIIEDISAEDVVLNETILKQLPGGEKVLDYFDKVTGTVLGDGAISVYKTLTIAPDTRVGDLLLKSTQYSDFISRYALYKYRTEEENVDHKAALNEIVDTFINYDINT